MFSVCLSAFLAALRPNMSNFDDIRPYNDDEVHPTLSRLVQDSEFIDAIVSLKYPRFSRLAAPLARPLARRALNKEIVGVHSINGLQAKIEGYMASNFAETTTQVTTSGLDKLEKTKPYLFISNHRDIAMDPAFVNWVLYQQGFQTLQIAIGDNLLTKPFASDLMRLNKCFIVNRSATAPREKLKAAKKLSSYIYHSLNQEAANIWIAQREGRAKDSLDLTNPAIVSMLALNKPKSTALCEYVEGLNIVPVSISYEYDPCDEMKARELTLLAQDGRYEKAEHEDVQSIARGITGRKGHVHVAFGLPLGKEYESVDEVAKALDYAIADQYVLHPSNCAAYALKTGETVKLPVGKDATPYDASQFSEQAQCFKARLQQCPTAWREHWLNIYANPVTAKLRLA